MFIPRCFLEVLSDICTISIFHPDQALLWNDMCAIKANILRRMDSTSIGVRICCVKFVQKVVQIQTPGVITDPRVGIESSSEGCRC